MLLWLAKGRTDSAGLAPIWARITVNSAHCGSKSVEISTGIKTSPVEMLHQLYQVLHAAPDAVQLPDHNNISFAQLAEHLI